MPHYAPSEDIFFNLQVLVFVMTSSFVFLWDSCLHKHACLCVYVCSLCSFFGSFFSLFCPIPVCLLLLLFYIVFSLFLEMSLSFLKIDGKVADSDWRGNGKGNHNQNMLHEKVLNTRDIEGKISHVANHVLRENWWISRLKVFLLSRKEFFV